MNRLLGPLPIPRENLVKAEDLLVKLESYRGADNVLNRRAQTRAATQQALAAPEDMPQLDEPKASVS